MSASDLEQMMEQYRRAVDAFVRGGPEPQKRLWSRRDDVTFANPLGPRGWNQVAEIIGRVASQLREGEAIDAKRIADYATADLQQ